MRIEMTPLEARVIGCLIEKEITTPDQYPLSLSALTNACNQKSNRNPVLGLTETEVQAIVDELLKKHLISDRGGFGSRVTKFQHRFCNGGFGSLEFSAQELGVLCVLLLRGPQTPGELRMRTNRLCEFSDVHETESVLQHLTERQDGPFVERLAREPGKRESRYAHLFSGETSAAQGLESKSHEFSTSEEPTLHIEQLERSVRQLQEQLLLLEARVGTLEQSNDPQKG